MPSDVVVRIDLLKNELATIEASVQSVAERVAASKIDREASRAALADAKHRLTQMNVAIASLEPDLN